MPPDVAHRTLLVRRTLLASLISIVLTLLGVLVPMATFEDHQDLAVALSFVLLVVATGAAAGVLVLSYVDDLRSARSSLEAAGLATGALPMILTFERRHDSFLIDADGNGHVTWDWEISSRAEDSISELRFPMVFTTTAPAAEPAVEVRAISVNDKPLVVPADAFGIDERRTLLTAEAKASWAGAESIDHALVRVPVNLEAGSTFARVQITLFLRKAFARPVEQVIVDVPYVTKRLRVTVEYEGRIARRVPSVGGSAIAARSAMNLLDIAECTSQNRCCRQDGRQLVWETEEVKISYSYALHVRAEEPST